ncbi:MAG: NACHT domain-containing protein [Acidobacteriota bacterium]|nr:NACHT domain-containing protein [Acidobacteriota bacterium]
MTGGNKKLFLSAVSSEFESYRELLTRYLKRPTLDVFVQEDFLVSGGSTLQKLDDYIKACHGVVHLIGKATGAIPEPVAVRDLLVRYPDFAERLPSLSDRLQQDDPRFSYTQWEAYLAIYHKRPIFIYRPFDFECNEAPSPREDRFVYDADEEISQHEHYRRICALGRDRGLFLNQERLSSAVLRDLVEILPRLEFCIDIPPTRLRHTAEVLIGRHEELNMLDAAWNDAHKNIVVVRGKGGEGKTSLVASWMAELAAKNWRGAEFIFDWSFYSQGTRAQGTATAESFLLAALAFMGDPDPNLGGPEDRGARLARLMASKRGLLVLDGLEPLQYPPGAMHGQLTDRGMAALLRGLAGRNDGLCVVTTREKVDEIKQHYGKSAIDHPLEVLSALAGAALLHYVGAQRAGEKTIAADDHELQQASIELRGHALTLFLVGQYLRLTEQGDIRRRDRMKLADAEAEYKNDATRPYGHAFKAIEAYENWLGAGDAEAKRQLVILRLLGLFDRPASSRCLEALRAEPTIPGLTDALAGGPNTAWTIALARLREISLVDFDDDESVDCHPLIREYFAMQLKTMDPNAWRTGHRRLFEYLCANTHEGDQPTLETLQPLYQAIPHGCQAGLQEEAYEVWHDRILRCVNAVSTKKLGAFASDLGVAFSFFESPWDRISPVLEEPTQALILHHAAFCLRALGRLIEALEPMKVSGEIDVKLQRWDASARSFINVSELEVTLGSLDEALDHAKRAVAYAGLSGDTLMRVVSRTTEADALHQAGRRVDAEKRFRRAEQMQAENALGPRLHSLRGFQYCDLLLARAERAAWAVHGGAVSSAAKQNAIKAIEAVCRRMKEKQKWKTLIDSSPLDDALDDLILARAAMYHDLVSSQFSVASAKMDDVVERLRGAGYQEFIVQGLLTRAWCWFAHSERALHDREGEALEWWNRSKDDLDQVGEIATRAPMPLSMADTHLYRARLFGRMKHEGSMMTYPWESPEHDLKEARSLIEKHGYWRRKEELEHAEAARSTSRGSLDARGA